MSMEDATTTNQATEISSKIFFGFAAIYLLLIISQFYWAGVALINETPDSTNHIATAAIIGIIPLLFVLFGFYMDGFDVVDARSGSYMDVARVVFWTLLIFAFSGFFAIGIWETAGVLGGEELGEDMNYPDYLKAITVALAFGVLGGLFYSFKGSLPVPSDWRVGSLLIVPFILSHVQYVLIWPFQDSWTCLDETNVECTFGEPLGWGAELPAYHALNAVVILLFSLEILRRTMPKALGDDYAFGFRSSESKFEKYTKWLYYIPMALMLTIATEMISEILGMASELIGL